MALIECDRDATSGPLTAQGEERFLAPLEMTGSVYGSSEVALGASHDPRSTSLRAGSRLRAVDLSGPALGMTKNKDGPLKGAATKARKPDKTPGRGTQEWLRYVGREPEATTISRGKAVCLPSQYLRRPARISATAAAFFSGVS